MWEKRRMLLKDYSATLINNLWGLHHCTHLPHHFTRGFEASIAPQSCLFCNHFSDLIQPTDSAAPNHRSCFSTCSYLTSPLGHKYPLWWSGFECWHVHLHGPKTCTNVQILEGWGNYLRAHGAQTNSTCVCDGGGAVLCVDNRAGLHYLPCTAHW